MSMIQRIRNRRQTNRQNRALDRAMHAALTPATRDEIVIFAQQRIF